MQVPWFNQIPFSNRFWHFEHVLSLSIKYFKYIFQKKNKLLRLFVKRGVLNNSHSAYYFNRQTIRYFEPNAYRLLWSSILLEHRYVLFGIPVYVGWVHRNTDGSKKGLNQAKKFEPKSFYWTRKNLVRKMRYFWWNGVFLRFWKPWFNENADWPKMFYIWIFEKLIMRYFSVIYFFLR